MTDKKNNKSLKKPIDNKKKMKPIKPSKKKQKGKGELIKKIKSKILKSKMSNQPKVILSTAEITPQIKEKKNDLEDIFRDLKITQDEYTKNVQKQFDYGDFIQKAPKFDFIKETNPKQIKKGYFSKKTPYSLV